MATEEVVSALLDPRAYGEGAEEIRLIQTHISFVFLTGRHAYKIKKPVNFGFLDFTTLEKRRFYCEEEVRINSAISPDLYLGVVPISRGADGRIRVGGEGEVLEYAVKMRELPQTAMMSGLLERKEVTERHIDTIAKRLSEFHERARSGAGVDEYGSVDQIRHNWVENFDQTRSLKGTLIDIGDFDYLEAEALGFIEREAGRFSERVRQGKVRECHGDLHSGNIFILDGIHIFDAIEFNKAFSCSDVAAEVAFLTMDLEFHGRADLAEHFIDRYVEYSGDCGLLALLPFYKCYRAYVRGKVTSFKLHDPNIPAGEKTEAEALAKRYFALALEHARALG
ncbi:MAG: hypothetical protein AABX40_02775 [Candidatus Hydrothermarchaeota archaeon]